MRFIVLLLERTESGKRSSPLLSSKLKRLCILKLTLRYICAFSLLISSRLLFHPPGSCVVFIGVFGAKPV